MRTRSKLALIGFGAMLLMALAVSTASAGKFSLSNQNIRITFRTLEFAVEGVGTDSCSVTLEGSFHSQTFTKTPETLIGFLTRVTTGNCSMGTTVLTATLPWHVRYVGFSGALPNISSIMAKVIGASVNVGAFGINCLARPNIELRSTREGSGGITGVDVPGLIFPVTSGGGLGCPAETASFQSGETGGVFLLGTTSRITVTLI